jgi:hypothetical protein
VRLGEGSSNLLSELISLVPFARKLENADFFFEIVKAADATLKRVQSANAKVLSECLYLNPFRSYVTLKKYAEPKKI